MSVDSRQIARLGPEVDVLALSGVMEGTANVRDRISRWMSRGLLVGVAPGHYVTAPELRKRPVSLEILANRIYGPSYVSFEYVLSRAGLIPEAVYGVTSATSKRNREVDTPFGRFSYRQLPLSVYAWGYTREELPDGAGFLIARPEKALLDLLYRTGAVRSVRALRERLYDDLRIEPDDLAALDLALLAGYAARMPGATFRVHLRKLLEDLHE